LCLGENPPLEDKGGILGWYNGDSGPRPPVRRHYNLQLATDDTGAAASSSESLAALVGGSIWPPSGSCLERVHGLCRQLCISQLNGQILAETLQSQTKSRLLHPRPRATLVHEAPLNVAWGSSDSNRRLPIGLPNLPSTHVVMLRVPSGAQLSLMAGLRRTVRAATLLVAVAFAACSLSADATKSTGAAAQAAAPRPLRRPSVGGLRLCA
jgi:hypothetical protein